MREMYVYRDVSDGLGQLHANGACRLPIRNASALSTKIVFFLICLAISSPILWCILREKVTNQWTGVENHRGPSSIPFFSGRTDGRKQRKLYLYNEWGPYKSPRVEYASVSLVYIERPWVELPLLVCYTLRYRWVRLCVFIYGRARPTI